MPPNQVEISQRPVRFWLNRYPQAWHLRRDDSFKYCKRASFQCNAPETNTGMVAAGTNLVTNVFLKALHAK